MVLTTFWSNIRKQNTKNPEPMLLLMLHIPIADDQNRIPSTSRGILVHEVALRNFRVGKEKKRVYTSARAALLSTLLRFSRPLSDHGKWATGMMKNELLGSAIPARALYLEYCQQERTKYQISGLKHTKQ